jgi:hypothetical protein
LELPQKGAEKGHHSNAVVAKTPHAPARLSDIIPSQNQVIQFLYKKLHQVMPFQIHSQRS